MKKNLLQISVINKFFLLLVTGIFILSSNNLFASGTIYINQDFENPSFPPSSWNVSNTSGYNWLRTTLCSGYGAGVSSAMVDFYDYATGNFDMVTKTFPVTTAGDSLVFDHAYASAAGENDQLAIYTSADNGGSWSLLISLNGGAAGPLVTASPTQHLFVPTSTQWATKSYVLPVGTNKIKFTAITAFGNNLYLDNVRIGAAYTNDAGANSIISPKYGIVPGTVTPKASVKNYGNAMQSFQVTMTINPGGYTNSQSVTNLAPGQTQILTFNNYTFSTNGTYILKAYSSLSGEQNTSNDTISANVVVTNAPRNVVLEFCTGTWCQWCPCGDRMAELLEENYPNSVILAYHGASTDPWKTFNGSNIISLLGFAGYPSGLIDRRLGNNNGWGSFFTDGEYRYSQSPAATVNLSLTSFNYNATTRELTANIDATALTNLTGQYKITYVVTENNLVYPQTGNSYCPGSSTWVHNWTVRNMVNGATGENLNSGDWNNGQTISKSVTTTLTASWVAANSKLQVFVYKDNGTFNISEMQQGINSPPITTTGIQNQSSLVPDKYELTQNYPNPFNPVTNIKFAIPKGENVSLKVYDILGQTVAVFVDGFIRAGYYNAEFDASNYSSGTYFYTLKTKDFTQTKQMVLIK